MIAYPNFANMVNNDNCSYLAAEFVEQNIGTEIFLYPGLKAAGAFKFADEMQEYCFIQAEHERLCNNAWNNSESVISRDYEKDETEEEFRMRENAEDLLWKSIKTTVSAYIQAELKKIEVLYQTL